MKVLHRIRGCLIVLLIMIHCCIAAKNPPDYDFKDCGSENAPSLICIVHYKACVDPSKDKDRFGKQDHDEIKSGCKRYLVVRAISLEKVEIEFRDDEHNKAESAEFLTGRTNLVFKCAGNEAVNPYTGTKIENNDSKAKNYDKMYCKFDLVVAPNGEKNIQKLLVNNLPSQIKYGNKAIRLDGLDFNTLHFPCNWNHRLFTDNQFIPIADDPDEGIRLVQSEQNDERTCPKDENKNQYFLKYHKQGERVFETISNYACVKGEIIISKLPSGSEIPDLANGMTTCVRKKCAGCPVCSNCEEPLPTAPPTNCSDKPYFVKSDGETCALITCPGCKGMKVESDSGSINVPNITLECSVTKLWPGFNKMESISVTCLAEIRCTQLNPIKSECPDQIPKGKTCNETILLDEGKLCAGADTWFVPPEGGSASQVSNFQCNATTGNWQGNKEDNEDLGYVRTDSIVYCLSTEEKAVSAPSQGGLPAGQLIAIIIGVGVAVAIIVAVVVCCLKRNLKKKGNRDEMKSVSVTGRGDKKNSRKKKGSKSSNTSKTSEISAPPPPPCPDSLSFNVEPDPVRSGAPPSSGGGAAPVGPDTGKPDKPAELIDINSSMVSEKKADSSKKSGVQEPTVVNTVTGTDSKAEPAGGKKDGTVTDTTKKADKNGESAKSDTGRISKVEGGKKKRNKDQKVTLDKNGKGLTDDDEFNIDEGAKPVNHDDKNKKPYAPAVDPRKKMINVTMTEDEDGHVKPKAKPNSPF